MESAIQKALTKFGNDNNIKVSIDRENGNKDTKSFASCGKSETNTEITIEDAHKKIQK